MRYLFMMGAYDRRKKVTFGDEEQNKEKTGTL